MRLVMQVGIAAVLALAAERHAHACDCPIAPPTDVALAKAAFVGIVEVDPASPLAAGRTKSGPRSAASLPVVRVFKGALEKSAVSIAAGGGDCSYFPTEAGRHLVYLYERPGLVGFQATVCSRSQRATSPEGLAEIAALERIGSGRASAAPSESASPSASAPASAAPPASAAAAPSSAPARGGCAGCEAAPVAATNAWPLAAIVVVVFARRRRDPVGSRS